MPNNFTALQPFLFTSSTADDLDVAMRAAHRNAAATAATLTIDATRYRLTETVGGVTTTYDFPWATYTTPIALANAVRNTQSTGSSTVNAPIYPFKLRFVGINGDEVISTLAFITQAATNLISATNLDPGVDVLWDTSVLLFRAGCAGREAQVKDAITLRALSFEEKTSKGVLSNSQLDPSYPSPYNGLPTGRTLAMSLSAWLKSLSFKGTHAGQTGTIIISLADQNNAGIEIATFQGFASATAYTLDENQLGSLSSGPDQRIVIKWIATAGAITVDQFSFVSDIGYFNGAV